MSESATKPDGENSYGELLGQYFAVVAEIAPMLDEFGRPNPEHYPEYSQLRTRKNDLHEALEQATPDHDTTEIKTILNEAFTDRPQGGKPVDKIPADTRQPPIRTTPITPSEEYACMTSNPTELDDDSWHVISLRSDDRLSEVILEAVSAVSDQSFSSEDLVALEELESLYDSVDPDALERLFCNRDTEAQLTFYFAGCEVEFVNGSHVSVNQVE